MSLDINFKGHNLEVTDALRDLTTGKLQRLEKHFDHITNVNIIFGVEKLDQVAEAIVNVPGNQLFAKASSADMYKSIDLMVDKLDKQILKYKQKMQDHHADRPDFNEADED